MKSIQVTLAAAALLLSGTAFAAQPAAGEAPYFNAPVASTSASSVHQRMRFFLRVGGTSSGPHSPSCGRTRGGAPTFRLRSEFRPSGMPEV